MKKTNKEREKNNQQMLKPFVNCRDDDDAILCVDGETLSLFANCIVICLMYFKYKIYSYAYESMC